ncbi:MAG: protoporphyrinogen oxidase [Gammaproteobacteria bacterium]|nr:protoporphyrinogen oxidase [Gammaproteobacteria bacterium]
MSDSDVIIIGAGISGLSTAWWLAQQGVKVEVWESQPTIGGKIKTTTENGYMSESAAGLLVNFRPEIDRVIKSSGVAWAKQQRPDNLKRYVLHQGQLCPVPMTFTGIARSPLWSHGGKLRMLAEGLISGKGAPGESVSQFIKRRFGPEMLNTAIDPFVSGTLASDPDLAEAASVLPRLKTLENRYGSITSGMLVNKLWKQRRINRADTFSFDGGMSQLIEAMAAAPGIHIRRKVTIRQIEPDQNGWQVHAETPYGSLNQISHQLVMTTPANISAQLLSGIDQELSQLLGSIEYAPIAVLHMGFDRQQITHPLDGTGFLVAKRDRLNLNGNLWMSSLFPQRAPAGKALLTSYLGGARHPGTLDLPDSKLITHALDGLSRLLGIDDTLEYVRLNRHHKGLPLYHGQYQAKLHQIHTCTSGHSGLHLCGNYAGGVSVRERIYQGKMTAQRITQELHAQGSNLSCTSQHKLVYATPARLL